MSKPKNMTPEQEAAWKAKQREYYTRPEVRAKMKEYQAKYRYTQKRREYQDKWQAKYNAKPEVKAKIRAREVKRASQTAADQFFIMAGAAESLTNLIKPNKKTK